MQGMRRRTNEADLKLILTEVLVVVICVHVEASCSLRGGVACESTYTAGRRNSRGPTNSKSWRRTGCQTGRLRTVEIHRHKTTHQRSDPGDIELDHMSACTKVLYSHRHKVHFDVRHGCTVCAGRDGEEGVCGEAWRVACLTSGLRKLATTSYEVGGTRLPTLRSADYQAGGPWDRRGGCQSEGANPVIISLAAPPMLLARRRRARNQDPPKP